MEKEGRKRFPRSGKERRGELVSFDKETSINRKRNTTRRSRSRSTISIGRAVDMYRLSRATRTLHSARAYTRTAWPAVGRCVTRICRGLKNSLESGRIDATVAVIKRNLDFWQGWFFSLRMEIGASHADSVTFRVRVYAPQVDQGGRVGVHAN